MTGAAAFDPRAVNEITALIHDYAAKLDRGDLNGVAALFEHAELGSTRNAILSDATLS